MAVSRIDWIRVLLWLSAGLLMTYAGILMGIRGKVEDADIGREASVMAGCSLAIATIGVARTGRGRRLAEALLLGGTLVTVGLLAAMFFPVIVSAMSEPTGAMCSEATKKLLVNSLIYAGDNDETFSLAANWRTATQLPLDPKLKCPKSSSPWSFAMNDKVSGLKLSKIADAAKTVVIFEADSNDPNAHGGPDKWTNRHGSVGSAGGAIISKDNPHRWNP
jgi:hypothetical protein